VKLVVDRIWDYTEYEVCDGYVDCDYGLLPVEEAIERFSKDGYYCYISEEDEDFEW